MVVFGLVPAEAFAVALVVMFLRAVMVPMIRGSVMAIFQAHVPPVLQGRVFTLLISSISVMAPFGLAIGGPLADAWGARVVCDRGRWLPADGPRVGAEPEDHAPGGRCRPSWAARGRLNGAA